MVRQVFAITFFPLPSSSSSSSSLCSFLASSIVRNSIMAKTWKICALCLAAASIVTMQAGRDTTVTAAQANGTWATPAGEFKIWALDDHRLRVEFSVAAEHKGVSGPMGNASDGHGIARIQGDTAIFKPDGADPDCGSP
jgi:hypothetical protein